MQEELQKVDRGAQQAISNIKNLIAWYPPVQLPVAPDAVQFKAYVHFGAEC